MIKAGDVISYLEMCTEEGVNLQRGMNYRLRGRFSVILMSRRPGAPYADRIEENGQVLIYEGHDVPQVTGGPNPKAVDQPMYGMNKELTQNGLFFEAALKHKRGQGKPEVVKVYEKIRAGIWVFNGFFRLIDSWQESDGTRQVFKFRLELAGEVDSDQVKKQVALEHVRLIPTSIKLEVWKRDKGKCVICGRSDNLHFDHIIPYSKGGASLVAENVQLLCARHNLAKRDKIE